MWQLFILLILAVFISATFLRLNNIGMIERREAVLSADETGDDNITQTRLYDLQRYVSAHMNTDMGKGIYLEGAYKRDMEAAYNKLSSEDNIYKKAQNVCAPQFTSWSQAYVQCTVSELAKYPEAETVELPLANMYLHTFVSPLWSSDFAGWSVVFCIVILTMIIIRLIGVLILKLLLRHRYKSV
ncbi:MAG: hypothetical protein PWQ10_189 [Patescibacteria group bacterium]|nr:hypothetical protein [Patescibacteria group bacterium]